MGTLTLPPQGHPMNTNASTLPAEALPAPHVATPWWDIPVLAGRML